MNSLLIIGTSHIRSFLAAIQGVAGNSFQEITAVPTTFVQDPKSFFGSACERIIKIKSLNLQDDRERALHQFHAYDSIPKAYELPERATTVLYVVGAGLLDHYLLMPPDDDHLPMLPWREGMGSSDVAAVDESFLLPYEVFNECYKSRVVSSIFNQRYGFTEDFYKSFDSVVFFPSPVPPLGFFLKRSKSPNMNAFVRCGFLHHLVQSHREVMNECFSNLLPFARVSHPPPSLENEIGGTREEFMEDFVHVKKNYWTKCIESVV